MSPAQLRQAAAQVGLDCSAGRHVARLGDPCVGCGDPGPPPVPLRKLELRPVARKRAELP